MSRWFEQYGFARIEDDLWLGAVPCDEADVAAVAAAGARRVLNLVRDEEYRPGARALVGAAYARADIEEHRIDLLDFGHLPSAAIEEAVTVLTHWLDARLCSYVHCRAGWQRSAAVAGGLLAVRRGIDLDEALAEVRRHRTEADPLPHQREDLERWWSERGRAAPSDGAV